MGYVEQKHYDRIDRFVRKFSSNRVGVSPYVPREMVDGPPDESGWVPWKPVDNPMPDQNLRKLEELYHVSFPPLFRAYLLHKCLLMTDFVVRLPQTPVDKPLSEIEQRLQLLDQESFFRENSLIPFGDDANDVGPVCFDLKSPIDGEDYAVVVVDHHRTREPNYRGEFKWKSFADLLDEIESTFEVQ